VVVADVPLAPPLQLLGRRLPAEALYLLKLLAEEIEVGFVSELASGVLAVDPDRQGRAVSYCAKARFALAQTLFRPLARGDVTIGYQHQPPPVRVGQRLAAFDNHFAPVFGRLTQLARPLALRRELRTELFER